MKIDKCFDCFDLVVIAIVVITVSVVVVDVNLFCCRLLMKGLNQHMSNESSYYARYIATALTVIAVIKQTKPDTRLPKSRAGGLKKVNQLFGQER